MGPAVGTVVGSHPEDRENRKNVILTKHFANTFQGKVCSFGAPSGTRWNYKIMVFNCEWLQLFSLSDPYLYNLLTTADKSDCPNKQKF